VSDSGTAAPEVTSTRAIRANVSNKPRSLKQTSNRSHRQLSDSSGRDLARLDFKFQTG
jgi:hypothetical protein